MTSDNTAASIPGHFGDIMASSPAQQKGSPNLTTNSLALLPHGLDPIERVICTANGNLQRILSALLNEVVHVSIIKNEFTATQETEGLLEGSRFVRIHTQSHPNLCTAESSITLSHPEYIQLIQSGTIGIGQLFRFKNILPEFQLLSVEKNDGNGGVWLERRYILHSPGIECVIHEVFTERPTVL